MSAAYGQSRPASEAPRELGNLQEQVKFAHEQMLRALKAEKQARDRYEDAKTYAELIEQNYLNLNLSYLKLVELVKARHHQAIDELERKQEQNHGK